MKLWKKFRLNKISSWCQYSLKKKSRCQAQKTVDSVCNASKLYKMKLFQYKINKKSAENHGCCSKTAPMHEYINPSKQKMNLYQSWFVSCGKIKSQLPSQTRMMVVINRGCKSWHFVSSFTFCRSNACACCSFQEIFWNVNVIVPIWS